MCVTHVNPLLPVPHPCTIFLFFTSFYVVDKLYPSLVVLASMQLVYNSLFHRLLWATTLLVNILVKGVNNSLSALKLSCNTTHLSVLLYIVFLIITHFTLSLIWKKIFYYFNVK